MVKRIHANKWLGAPILILTVFFLRQANLLHAQGDASDRRLGVAAQQGPILTLDDVIDLALRVNRGLISSVYGIEGQELSLAAARSEFELKLFSQATAEATDKTRRFGFGVTVQKKFAPGPVAGVSPEVFRRDDGNSDDAYGSRARRSLNPPSILNRTVFHYLHVKVLQVLPLMEIERLPFTPVSPKGGTATRCASTT